MKIYSQNMFSTSYSLSDDEKSPEILKRNNVLDFIYQLLRKRCEPGEFIEFIKDGTIIEELMTRACPTPLGKKLKNKYSTNPTPKQRVEKVINDMFEYGVSLDYLFEPEDLINAKDIPKVCENRII